MGQLETFPALSKMSAVGGRADEIRTITDIGHEKTTMIYGLYSWSGAIRRRQSAIQHIGPDNVFLPSRYYLASMNAVLEMHAMGEA